MRMHEQANGVKDGFQNLQELANATAQAQIGLNETIDLASLLLTPKSDPLVVGELISCYHVCSPPASSSTPW